MHDGVKQGSRFVPLAASCDGCHGQATTIGLDGCPRCAVCQLDWLAAEEQGVETCTSSALAVVRAAVAHEYADPVELCSKIVALLRNDAMISWAPVRHRRTDVSAALQALKDQMRGETD